MSLAFISTGDFVSVLLRSTKEQRIPFWCFLDGFVIAYERLKSVGFKLHQMALILSLGKLFMPVPAFLMAVGVEPGSLWRVMT